MQDISGLCEVLPAIVYNQAEVIGEGYFILPWTVLAPWPPKRFEMPLVQDGHCIVPNNIGDLLIRR